MRPVFNLEPKYRVTMLTREEWTRRPGARPIVKGLVWFTNGSRMMEGTGARVFFGHSSGTRLIISLEKHATLFQVEVYAVLACVYKIQTQDRPELVFAVIARQL